MAVNEKAFRTRLIVGILLENRGIRADNVSAAEMLEAEVQADAYVALMQTERGVYQPGPNEALKPS